ncbi:unnamed protein product [Mesocestoides corti]|uniref:Nuclear receptor domain-containing protein n=1 Tax=Mesocestoides corti TaxID=53468 RepID=A0A0R3U8K6_MESCO|nr:unnamed protein product [Mesocestoides corti]
MIDDVEDVRISSFQPFETISLAARQRENDRLSQSRVMYFDEDMVDSVSLTTLERPKKLSPDPGVIKLHGFLPSDSSWVSPHASETSPADVGYSTCRSKSSLSAPSVSSAYLTDEMTPEFAFTQYQRRSEDQACQVCGQPSVGFHHRAYKFFTRHLTNRIKKDKPATADGEPSKPTHGDVYADLSVACPMGGNCKIEGPGRGKCPHCRFRKCLDLGMSLTHAPPVWGCVVPCSVSPNLPSPPPPQLAFELATPSKGELRNASAYGAAVEAFASDLTQTMALWRATPHFCRARVVSDLHPHPRPFYFWCDLVRVNAPPGGELGCDVSKIPCRVCGGPSSGFHFGALTCEGCKGFFRRTVHSSSIPQCLGNQTCRITPSNRNMCKSCRFKKCLEVGMSQKRSRVGRQPNAIKYYCVREISQREQNGALPSPDESIYPKRLATQTHPPTGVSPTSPTQLQSSLRLPSPVKRSHSSFDLIGAAVPAATTTSVDLVAGDGGGSRSRASTLSTSSGVSSSSVGFQNRLDPQQTSPVISSSSSSKGFKPGDLREFDVGVDALDGSFCQQLASVPMASSFANQFLLNPQFAGGSCSSQFHHNQPTPTTEFLRQLAKHHPSMVAAAAASLLWGNPPAGSMFESGRGQTGPSSPPHPCCSQRFHLQHPQPATAFQPVATTSRSESGGVRANEERASTDAESNRNDLAASQRLHGDVVRAGSEAASCVRDGIMTNVFVSLAEFTQAIERAADFLKSERLRLKRFRNDAKPRFTIADTAERVWSQMMRQFVSHTRMVVDFSKLIAGFNRLGINDRRQLIRAAMYPIMLIELSRDFQNNGSLSYNYFDFPSVQILKIRPQALVGCFHTPTFSVIILIMSLQIADEHERDVIIHHFPPLVKIVSHLVQSGKVLQHLKLDDKESTIICIQELLRHKNELEDPASCEHLFLLSMQALVNHEQRKSKSDAASERLTTFTQLLPMLNQLNAEHHEVLGEIRSTYPHLVFPELYTEMFAIGAEKPPHFFQADASCSGL